MSYGPRLIAGFDKQKLRSESSDFRREYLLKILIVLKNWMWMAIYRLKILFADIISLFNLSYAIWRL